MDLNKEAAGTSPSNHEDKKLALFVRQKNLLDTFLEHGAISRSQYDKSLHDLIEKMGITDSSITGREKT